MNRNFFDTYETIVTKLKKENDQAGIAKLKKAIKENENFSRAFFVYNHFKNKTVSFDILKEFADGLKISDSSLKKLLEFFNIKDVKPNKLNESLSNIILYKNKSLGTNLTTIKEDEESVKKYLTDDKEDCDDELTYEESSAINIIENKDYKRLNALTGYIYALSNKINESKEKVLIQESLKQSIKKSKSNLIESTLNIFSVYSRIQQINESQFGGPKKIEIPNVGLFKMNISTEEDYRNPEYIIVQVKLGVPFLSKGQEERAEEIKSIKNSFIKVLKINLKKGLDPKTFEMSNVITDTSAGIQNKLCYIISQIYLEVKRDEIKEKSLIEYRGDFSKIFKFISSELEKEIPQLNKNFSKVS